MEFTADLDDIRFVLYEQLDVEKDLRDIEKYADFDRDTFDAMLDEAYTLAREVFDPINAVGDREGCKLDMATGSVTTPDCFKPAWNTMAEGGWISVTAPTDAGGIGAPSTLGVVVAEMFSGSAMAFQMYPGLTAAAARVMYRFGTDRMKEWSELAFTGQWGGTMCLTEAEAGSDVGDNRCKAVPQADGSYLLEGEKIFISGGDQDLTENIVHLVLARTPDSQPGTKGLSLFVVPKFRINDDNSLGERNGAFVVGIEEKMGIHGSATCVLNLGAQGPCVGWLLGEEHQGIELMFTMMNEARIGVGSQGVALAAAAYQYALEYTKERKQGSSIRNFKDPSAPKVTINQHPDVRRMLMTMKCQVEAMRSMLYKLGHRHDVAENCGDDEKEARLMGRVDLLVPILKSHCTDVGYEVAVIALQCLGGFGYIGEYPVEQVVRDLKIASVYEGTNGIQAMDLLGRKLRMKGGALFMEWMQDGMKACAEGKAEGFETECALIEKSINAIGAAAMHLGGLGGQGKLEVAMLQAVPFQRAFGTVQLAIECLEQARVAKKVIARDGESPLLVGKGLNLSFYVHNILPTAVGLVKAVTSGDDSCLDERLFV
jgi:alkylation response protein AidB-like acyl-CoA dehydrogenase